MCELTFFLLEPASLEGAIGEGESSQNSDSHRESTLDDEEPKNVIRQMSSNEIVFYMWDLTIAIREGREHHQGRKK
jgi:hypothetical protein